MIGVGLVASLFTPSVLFCVVNVMIGTIFIASSIKPKPNQPKFGQNEYEHPPQLGRVPSFLERVKSINLSRYRPEQPDPAVPAEEELGYQQPPQLGRVPSFLERVKSINLSRYWPEQPDQADSAVPAEEQLGHQQPPQLGRVPSFLERVKSINLSRFRPEQPDPYSYAVPAEEQATQKEEPKYEEPHHVTRSKSDRTAKKTPVAEAAVRVLKKSFSERVAAVDKEEEEEEEDVDRRRPATTRENTAAAATGGDDEAVDAKADDFINRFRQQLKLQRLDSILRYKEMLQRGTGS